MTALHLDDARSLKLLRLEEISLQFIKRRYYCFYRTVYIIVTSNIILLTLGYPCLLHCLFSYYKWSLWLPNRVLTFPNASTFV